MTSSTTDAWFDDARERARLGEHAAFDELVTWIERPLMGFIRARTGADPNELANTVLLRVFQSIDSFEGTVEQFRAWVFQIARNLIIDEHRYRSRRVDAVAVAPADMPDEEVPDHAADIEHTARVDSLLADLTADQREVILLRVVAGLGVDETAEAIGRRPGAVRALQHRALEALRKKLAQQP